MDIIREKSKINLDIQREMFEAIENNDLEKIQKLIHIFDDKFTFDKSLYPHFDISILHKAILEKKLEIFEYILKICQYKFYPFYNQSELFTIAYLGGNTEFSNQIFLLLDKSGHWHKIYNTEGHKFRNVAVESIFDDLEKMMNRFPELCDQKLMDALNKAKIDYHNQQLKNASLVDILTDDCI